MDQSQSSPQVTRSTTTSSGQRTETVVRKKPQPKTVVKKDKPDTLFLTKYMKEIIKAKQAKKVYECRLCKDKPILKRKCVYRHIINCEAHSLSITGRHRVGHDELIPLIVQKMEENKVKY